MRSCIPTPNYFAWEVLKWDLLFLGKGAFAKKHFANCAAWLFERGRDLRLLAHHGRAANVLIAFAGAKRMKNAALLALLVLAFAHLALFGCAGSAINEGIAAGGRPYRGAANPKVVIYEYSDFECPYCGRALPTIEEVLRAHPDSVQLQFRNFPLPGLHPRSFASAVAGVCAEEQGKFWAMHDKLFANQRNLEDSDLQKYAEEIGLDLGRFSACFSSSAAKEKVRADMAEGAALGLTGTPSFRIGDTVLLGASKLKGVVEAELAKAG